MKISILVPTLGNRIDEIRRLLNSLLVQTYKEFEVIFVSQDNHDVLKSIMDDFSMLELKQIIINEKGLSNARNSGLDYCKGEIVIFSDDDCWYPNDAMETINEQFYNKDIDVLLTKIYDLERRIELRSYSGQQSIIKRKYELLSRSSIEIAIKRKSIVYNFDELFGLGGIYASGEEIDFLLMNFKKDKVYYFLPKITVYHPKKERIKDTGVKAKGALYSKHFNVYISLLVLIRDLIKKKENNFRLFFEGYKSYKRNKNK